MSPWYEQAKKYYPALWSKERLEKLVELGRLTGEEADEIFAMKELEVLDG